MPRLVVGYTELGCSRWKRGKGFSKPNFEPGPIPLNSLVHNKAAGERHWERMLDLFDRHLKSK